jgi:predicted acetyltransferase
MAVEIRRPAEDELRDAMGAALAAFAETQEEADWERERESVRLERAVAAYDNGRPVGFSASYEFELTIPGGTVPTAGVTWVGVMPTHRRRGILRSFMDQLFADARENGEPLAALYASEAAIYGRFGYGVATQWFDLNAESKRVVFRDDAPETRATVRFVDEDEAFERFQPIYDRVRLHRPGMLSRTEHWWRRHRLADYEHRRRGASKRFNALLELDGEDAGYAVYRVKDEWEDGYPRGEVRLVEAFATSPEATRDLWRYLCNIDLTTRVQQGLFDPASPLFLMVADPRALHLKVFDGMWLRLLDVEDALRRRSYTGDDTVVLDVRDANYAENSGRYRVGSTVERTDDEADISLDVIDVASVYLGAFNFEQLASAGRAEELRTGSLGRASALFRTPLPPHCPEVF